MVLVVRFSSPTMGQTSGKHGPLDFSHLKNGGSDRHTSHVKQNGNSCHSHHVTAANNCKGNKSRQKHKHKVRPSLTKSKSESNATDILCQDPRVLQERKGLRLSSYGRPSRTRVKSDGWHSAGVNASMTRGRGWRGSDQSSLCSGVASEVSQVRHDSVVTDNDKSQIPTPTHHHIIGHTVQDVHKETERSKEAFMDLLASRYPQYAEKVSSTTSEDGFPVRGRSRDPQRRATVGYPQQTRSMDYEGTMSEVDGPTFRRGGFVRSSLPAPRSPKSALEKPPGLVFLIFRDETKKALLPNEITHLDTVRALFVRSFPGKLTMSFLESPKRKIYILEPRTNIYYQVEDLRDIKDRTVLRIHECDSVEPQRVAEKPEVRGRTVHIPTGSQGYYGSMPSSAITSKAHKAQQQQPLPSHMQHPIYMSHDDVTQSPVRTSYERSRSLTPDPARSASYAQNPIYGRMGISPERPPPPQERVGPPDRPPTLRTIPENYLMINGNKNGDLYNYGDVQYQQAPGAPSPVPKSVVKSYQRQAMSPPAVPTGPRVDPGRRAFSPPPSLQNYDYIQVIPSSSHQAPPGAPQQGSGLYMAKGVRASTVVTPQRATGASTSVTVTQPQQSPMSQHQQQQQQQHQQYPGATHQQTWRERSPVGRHTLPLSTVPYSGSPMTRPTHSGPQHPQRSQSYRVAPTADREPVLTARPRSMTPSPITDTGGNDTTRHRIDKMEHQLASLAAWVQTAVIQSAAPSSVQSTSTNSMASDASPGIDSSGSKVHVADALELKAVTDYSSDGTPTLTADMKTNILAIKHQADALRLDLHNLRRLQQINKESILETVDDAWKKIREALQTVPGAENLLIRQQRNEVDVMYQIYLEDKLQVEKELGDLEHAVEELRSDVLSRQCRVQMSDVEGMALILSHVTKALGELKARFPKLHDRLKFVMAAEMEVIVREEKFLKDEPERLDNALKKCKKLTGTLFTLKRLASVQEHRPPQVMAISASTRIPTMADRKTVLENIQAMVPDHEARIQGIQAAELARQRKKKIISQQEALRFGKSLELATKALKPSALTSDPGPSSAASQDHTILSFGIPMSTSTPKSASQQPSTSSPDQSLVSASSSAQPVMSLMKEVTSSRQTDDHYSALSDARSKGPERPGSGGKSGKTVEFKSDPAVLPLTSTETTTVASASGKKFIVAPGRESLSTQKSAARAAFFSSLASPVTPTSVVSSTPLHIPTTESPTESPPSHISPSRAIPMLVRSSAVSKPSLSISSSPSSTSSAASKPLHLPMSSVSSSVISSQKFSPASPVNGTQTASSSKSRTSFTAIPKPYSPTRSATSPLTPESPKYRIPPSQMSGDTVDKKAAEREPVIKPKKKPPPPPPRKSSKLPGHAVLAVNTATVNGTLSIGKQSKKLPKPESRADIIDPPKQFANLETKVERKSSIGSLKQFTTPLLESRRDAQLEEKERERKKSGLATQKISASNLDSVEQKSQTLDKDIDMSKEKVEDTAVASVDEGSRKKVVDGKVTNISAESKSDSEQTSGAESVSSSVDFGDDQVWMKRDDSSSDESISVTLISSEVTVEKSDSGLDSDKPAEDSVDVSTESSGKKKKPDPPARRSSLTSKPKTEEEPIDRLV